jgi:hypothetical protein
MNPTDTPETAAAIALASDPDGAREVCDLCERLERERDAALKDAEKARAYKRVLKTENARLRRMLNLPDNEKARPG